MHLDVVPVVSDEFKAVSFVETNGGFVCWSDFQLHGGGLGVCVFGDLADEPITDSTARFGGDVTEDPCLRARWLIEMPGT